MKKFELTQATSQMFVAGHCSHCTGGESSDSGRDPAAAMPRSPGKEREDGALHPVPGTAACTQELGFKLRPKQSITICT